MCFNEVPSRTSEQQDHLGIPLDKAMAQAHGSAGLVVSMGKGLVANRRELMSVVLPRVKEILPDAINRVQVSYGLALFAALKASDVCLVIYNDC